MQNNVRVFCGPTIRLVATYMRPSDKKRILTFVEKLAVADPTCSATIIVVRNFNTHHDGHIPSRTSAGQPQHDTNVVKKSSTNANRNKIAYVKKHHSLCERRQLQAYISVELYLKALGPPFVQRNKLTA